MREHFGGFAYEMPNGMSGRVDALAAGAAIAARQGRSAVRAVCRLKRMILAGNIHMMAGIIVRH
jgi:hypothetical protein